MPSRMSSANRCGYSSTSGLTPRKTSAATTNGIDPIAAKPIHRLKPASRAGRRCEPKCAIARGSSRNAAVYLQAMAIPSAAPASTYQRRRPSCAMPTSATSVALQNNVRVASAVKKRALARLTTVEAASEAARRPATRPAILQPARNTRGMVSVEAVAEIARPSTIKVSESRSFDRSSGRRRRS